MSSLIFNAIVFTFLINSIASKAINNSNDICSLKPDTGPCRAYLPRYYFDFETLTCKEFIYGGCNGNQNNFESQVDCYQTCKPLVSLIEIEPNDTKVVDGKTVENEIKTEQTATVPTVVVTEVPTIATTSSTTTSTVKMFETFPESNSTQANDITTTTLSPEEYRKYVCTQPMFPGPCSEALVRYYYDAEAGKCKEFLYGGCFGNDNNFEKIDACVNLCEVK